MFCWGFWNFSAAYTSSCNLGVFFQKCLDFSLNDSFKTELKRILVSHLELITKPENYQSIAKQNAIFTVLRYAVYLDASLDVHSIHFIPSSLAPSASQTSPTCDVRSSERLRSQRQDVCAALQPQWGGNTAHDAPLSFAILILLNLVSSC